MTELNHCSVAELAERPLYSVTCGDIGTDADSMEKYLETVLYLGKTWNCGTTIEDANYHAYCNKLTIWYLSSSIRRSRYLSGGAHLVRYSSEQSRLWYVGPIYSMDCSLNIHICSIPKDIRVLQWYYYPHKQQGRDVRRGFQVSHSGRNPLPRFVTISSAANLGELH